MTDVLVRTADELVAARDSGARRIVVRGEIDGLPTLTLAPGQEVVGEGDAAALRFASGRDGLVLTRDNVVSGLRVEVEPARCAIGTDGTIADLGALRLAGLVVTGRVLVRAGRGHVEIDGMDIVAADTRAEPDRPSLLGVGALPGAFTLWNRETDPAAVVTAQLRGLRAGRPEAPVRGSGILVAGTPAGGRVEVARLETGPVFTDGGLAEGTADAITGGVFVATGATVGEVRNLGPVTTYGVNDMVLDNWGAVEQWVAEAPLTSYGRAGVGMVNFGSLGTLRILAPIETFGPGARGFNVYRLDGETGPTVDRAEFESITTHGDGAVGIQIGQPIGQLVVHKGIETAGADGDSLVRGQIVRQFAHALSVPPGGRVTSIEVGGRLAAAGAAVTTVHVGGEVSAMRVAGGIRAAGVGADAVHVQGGTIRLTDTEVHAQDGVAVRVSGGDVRLDQVRAHGRAGDVVVER
jgi:hypothetical protein